MNFAPPEPAARPAPLTVREQAALLVSEAEAQRAALARSIHDDLAQQLTVASIELTLWQAEAVGAPDSNTAEKIEKLASLVSSVISSARTISSSLRPRTLDNFGLAAAIESLVAAFRARTGVACRFRAVNALQVSPEIAIQLVRIAELLFAMPEARQWHGSSVQIQQRNGMVELAISGLNDLPQIPAAVMARVKIFRGTLRSRAGRLVVKMPVAY